MDGIDGQGAKLTGGGDARVGGPDEEEAEERERGAFPFLFAGRLDKGIEVGSERDDPGLTGGPGTGGEGVMSPTRASFKTRISMSEEPFRGGAGPLLEGLPA
jgi:hypothetical protein